MIYKKLQELKQTIAETKTTKSGKNTFSGYSYFELQDFMPLVISTCTKLGMTSAMSFGKELATLTLVDIEEGDKVEFTMPVSEANLKGCHPVQNLGAVVTYTRRYLWLTALDITEADALDPVTGKKDSKEEKVDPFDKAKEDIIKGFEILVGVAGSRTKAYDLLGKTKAEVIAVVNSKDVMAAEELVSLISTKVDEVQ